ncbi:hypothetical protein ABPG72_014168 [Tetrahymena utriculariae]
MEIKRICIGSDHAGFGLKSELIKYIKNDLKLEIEDCGPENANRCDYPDFSVKICQKVLENTQENLGIAVCGSGVGISLGCNKVKGIRCGLSHDYYTAKYSKEVLNCNIMSMGERIIGLDVAKQMVEVFIKTQYKPTEESNTFIQELKKIEEENLNLQ